MLRRMYECVDAARHGIAWDDFRRHFEGWLIHPLLSSGAEVGAVAQRGPEVHIVFFSDPQSSIRGHLIQHLQRTIDEFGYAETLVELGNEKSMRFCKRLGFKPIEIRGGAILMRCKQFAYSRQT